MVFCINNRSIGPDDPPYIIAELSANHNGSLQRALQTIAAAQRCGADAVKLQTYTADTLTIDCNNSYFRIGQGTIWEGRCLYDLYREAYTPWEWQPKLFELARELGMECFSTPFDKSAVDFLEDLDPPAYKVASFELVDLPLIEYVASKGRPIIMSTGMGTLSEIEEAVEVVKSAGVPLTLLKCTSAYPSPPEATNLRTIPHMAEAFGVPVGLSDHTLGTAVPVAAIALGACVIEKHFTLSRDDGGPDSAFSLEPDEFTVMVDAVRTAKQALGKVKYAVTEKETASRVFRRSLFVVQDLQAGDRITTENVRSIRPGHGLPPKYYDTLLGRSVTKSVKAGTPMSWDLVIK
jgi:pseudaminic acid synthase